MTKDTGGSAFPNAEIRHSESGHSFYQGADEGMTLRDYFAAKALQGQLACQSPDTGEYYEQHYPELAGTCYKLADAMLAGREKKL